MAEVSINPDRPAILLKDSQGVVLSTHRHEFAAVTQASKNLPVGTYIVERPALTLVVK